MNIDFVQKKREEVPFSPKDHQSVESFLQVISHLNSSLNYSSSHICVTRLIKLLIWQVEKRNGNTPFTQYYKSIMSKAASRNSISDRKV